MGQWFILSFFSSAPLKSLAFCCTSDTKVKTGCQEDKFHNVKKSMGKLLDIYITDQVTDWSQILKKMKNFLWGV